jgi:hypothetical protein
MTKMQQLKFHAKDQTKLVVAGKIGAIQAPDRGDLLELSDLGDRS